MSKIRNEPRRGKKRRRVLHLIHIMIAQTPESPAYFVCLCKRKQTHQQVKGKGNNGSFQARETLLANWAKGWMDE